jgi:hypothetical protein
MLVVPYIAGLLAAGFAWPDIPLLVAWIAGYLFSYFALLAIKTRRYDRYRSQLLSYGSATVIAGSVVLIARPALLVFAPVFAVVLLVNGRFAANRDDRALVNGLVSAAAAMLILPVVAVVGGQDVWSVSGTFVVLLLYFAGTVLFVKTCIRERGNVGLLRASIAFHVGALAVAPWVAPLYAVPFAWFLARAVVVPSRRLTAKQLGVIEIGSSLALLTAVAIVG